jgi:hypothetical protein
MPDLRSSPAPRSTSNTPNSRTRDRRGAAPTSLTRGMPHSVPRLLGTPVKHPFGTSCLNDLRISNLQRNPQTTSLVLDIGRDRARVPGRKHTDRQPRFGRRHSATTGLSKIRRRIMRKCLGSLIALVLTVGLAAPAHADDHNCSLARSAGKWSFTDQGTVIGIGPRTAMGYLRSMGWEICRTELQPPASTSHRQRDVLWDLHCESRLQGHNQCRHFRIGNRGPGCALLADGWLPFVEPELYGSKRALVSTITCLQNSLDAECRDEPIQREFPSHGGRGGGTHGFVTVDSHTAS